MSLDGTGRRPGCAGGRAAPEPEPGAAPDRDPASPLDPAHVDPAHALGPARAPDARCLEPAALLRGPRSLLRAPLALVRATGRELLEGLLDLVFPETCPLCGTAGPASGCDAHPLPAAPAPGPRCGTCAVRLADVLPDGATCAACRRAPPRFARLVALGDYDEVLRAWILAWKHGGRRALAGPLGRALARRLLLLEGPLPPPLLVPVPLHPLRRLERGFDQAALLADELARALGGRSVRCLRRVRWTPRQGAPGARSRHANVRDAFACRRAAERAHLAAARPVWLVDDVATTGATLSACADVLRRAGARRVHALVLARVEPRSGASPA